LQAARSYGTLVLVGLTLAVAGLAFGLDHFRYDHTSGRQTPDGGLHEEDGIERTSIVYGPFRVEGDGTPSDPDAARLWTDVLGWTLVAAVAFLVVAGLCEVPGFSFMPRWSRLTALSLAAMSLAGVAYVGWYQLPATLSGMSVDGPFTAKLLGPKAGYIRTSIGDGWIAAASAFGTTLGAILMRYQAGSDDADLYVREVTA
jgi:hypothetical protein